MFVPGSSWTHLGRSSVVSRTSIEVQVARPWPTTVTTLFEPGSTDYNSCRQWLLQVDLMGHVGTQGNLCSYKFSSGIPGALCYMAFCSDAACRYHVVNHIIPASLYCKSTRSIVPPIIFCLLYSLTPQTAFCCYIASFRKVRDSPPLSLSSHRLYTG